MAGSADHIKALLRTHASGDDQAFYSVALQVAARAARQGHHRLAADLKSAVETSRSTPKATVTSIVRPRSETADLNGLVTVSHPAVDTGQLILPAHLRDALSRVLTEQRQRKQLLDHGFQPAHRILLEGPPGTGKTMTAAVLAHELSLPLLTVRLDGLLSKFMGETAAKLRTIFDLADQERSVVLFDEFDALGGDRAGNDVGEARRILNSFLVFLEESSSDSLIVAATNHRAMLDRALFRRFDMVLDYDLPDAQQGVALMRGRVGSLARGVRWPTLATAMAGLSHADLVRAAETAAKSVILAGRTHIVADDLRTALEDRRSSSLG